MSWTEKQAELHAAIVLHNVPRNDYYCDASFLSECMNDGGFLYNIIKGYDQKLKLKIPRILLDFYILGDESGFVQSFDRILKEREETEIRGYYVDNGVIQNVYANLKFPWISNSAAYEKPVSKNINEEVYTTKDIRKYKKEYTNARPVDILENMCRLNYKMEYQSPQIGGQDEEDSEENNKLRLLYEKSNAEHPSWNLASDYELLADCYASVNKDLMKYYNSRKDRSADWHCDNVVFMDEISKPILHDMKSNVQNSWYKDPLSREMMQLSYMFTFGGNISLAGMKQFVSNVCKAGDSRNAAAIFKSEVAKNAQIFSVINKEFSA